MCFTSEDILGFILPNLQETKDFLINEHLILVDLFSKQCSPWTVEVDILLEHFIKCNLVVGGVSPKRKNTMTVFFENLLL